MFNNYNNNNNNNNNNNRISDCYFSNTTLSHYNYIIITITQYTKKMLSFNVL